MWGGIDHKLQFALIAFLLFILRVNKSKYLGVLLDNTLSWGPDRVVEYICNKISSRLGILRRAKANLSNAL